jgi:uncharacterized protein (UPF0248 family)
MTKEDGYNTVVRILDRGQCRVNKETVRDINKVDNTIVEILENENKAKNSRLRSPIWCKQ